MRGSVLEGRSAIIQRARQLESYVLHERSPSQQSGSFCLSVRRCFRRCQSISDGPSVRRSIYLSTAAVCPPTGHLLPGHLPLPSWGYGYTDGDVTSHDLWSRYDRHFVGMKCRNEWRQAAKTYRVIQIKFNQFVKGSVHIIINLPTKPNESISQGQTFIRALPTRWRRKPADIDMELNYATVTLCIGLGLLGLQTSGDGLMVAL